MLEDVRNSLHLKKKTFWDRQTSLRATFCRRPSQGPQKCDWSAIWGRERWSANTSGWSNAPGGSKGGQHAPGVRMPSFWNAVKHRVDEMHPKWPFWKHNAPKICPREKYNAPTGSIATPVFGRHPLLRSLSRSSSPSLLALHRSSLHNCKTPLWEPLFLDVPEYSPQNAKVHKRWRQPGGMTIAWLWGWGRYDGHRTVKATALARKCCTRFDTQPAKQGWPHLHDNIEYHSTGLDYIFIPKQICLSHFRWHDYSIIFEKCLSLVIWCEFSIVRFCQLQKCSSHLTSPNSSPHARHVLLDGISMTHLMKSWNVWDFVSHLIKLLELLELFWLTWSKMLAYRSPIWSKCCFWIFIFGVGPNFMSAGSSCKVPENFRWAVEGEGRQLLSSPEKVRHI